jgi:hypothetical protein
MELRRFTPNDYKDRRRVLTAMGRFEETPAEKVICLGDNGYFAEGEDRGDVTAKDIITSLQEILTVDGPGKTFEQIVEDWPGKAGPNQGQLRQELKRGTKEDRWVRDGTGKKGDPYKYRKASSQAQPAPAQAPEATAFEAGSEFSTNSRPNMIGREYVPADDAGDWILEDTPAQPSSAAGTPENNSHSRPPLGAVENTNCFEASEDPSCSAEATPEADPPTAILDTKNEGPEFSTNSRPTDFGRESTEPVPDQQSQEQQPLDQLPQHPEDNFQDDANEDFDC